MKIHRILPARHRHARAFTLIELMVVIAIIAMLAALTMGLFTMANTTSARNRTTATLKAVEGALSRYKEANGDYPAPTSHSGAHSLTTVDGAQTLYQAVTGDGYDQIDMSTPSPSPNHHSSNGSVDPNFSSWAINPDFIPGKVNNADGSTTWRGKLNSTFVDSSGKFYLVDGFGHPFQYDRAALPGQAATTINTDYDLWSYANIGSSDSTDGSLNNKGSGTATSIWIKNW